MFKRNIITFIAVFILAISGLCIYTSAKGTSVADNVQPAEIARPVHIFENAAGAAVARNVERNIAKKQKIKKIINSHRISFKLLCVLCFVLVFPIVVSILLIKKFNSLVKNVQNTCNSDVKKTINQLNEFQNNIKENYNIDNFKDIETNPDKLAQDIDNFLAEIKQEELNKIEIKPITQQPKNKFVQPEKRIIPKPKKFTSPKLISQKPISKTKGFYLVDCGKEKALVGYIKDEIFILNKFSSTVNSNIQVRLTEKLGNKYIFIVKNGTYKALVQVEKERMKVLLEM